MNRSLMAGIAGGVLALAGITHGAPKPNIIVIYTDDQGFGDASCLNPAAKFQTPNLDRLAKEGINFTNGLSPDTVCTPSRYGLLTGRYCWRTEKKFKVLGAEATCLITALRSDGWTFRPLTHTLARVPAIGKINRQKFHPLEGCVKEIKMLILKFTGWYLSASWILGS
jgi:hypothetical protein